MEIILIRHGKPTAATNPILTAGEFSQWVKHYDQSRVDIQSRAPQAIFELTSDAFIVSSALPRAIHSAEIVTSQLPNYRTALLNEMQMPSHSLPLKLAVSHWLILNRLLWLFGFSGKTESFKLVKIRANLIATELAGLAKEKRKVVVFGHGLMNRQVAKELNKLGWNSNPHGKGYWGLTRLSYFL